MSATVVSAVALECGKETGEGEKEVQNVHSVLLISKIHCESSVYVLFGNPKFIQWDRCQCAMTCKMALLYIHLKPRSMRGISAEAALLST